MTKGVDITRTSEEWLENNPNALPLLEGAQWVNINEP